MKTIRNLFIYSLVLEILFIQIDCSYGWIRGSGLGHKINTDLDVSIDEPVLNADEDIPEQLNRTTYNNNNNNIGIPVIDDILGTGNNDSSRIVGGSKSSSKRWPWIAALMRRSKSKPFCGGSLINHNTIMTAGHCVKHESPSSLTVRLGADDMSRRESFAKDYGVRSIKVHPSYNYPHNDIAIIKLKSKVKYNKRIKPIRLSANDNEYSGSSAVVAGWGTTSYGGRQAKRLREVDLKVWDTASCNGAVKEFPITSKMICAGGANGARKDACQGDSGGPLMHHGSSGWTLIGIVSFGDGCGKPNVPGVYTRVSKYAGWLKGRGLKF